MGLRTLLDRLTGGRRPPSGPLTTSEATEAEKVRRTKQGKDEERIEREQKQAGTSE
jgi:hypothetical protein